ncbi:MAG: CvpA family protein [Planctomycetota bacterium]|nr:CvpA family protein [Planctomycetota bacterium]
MNALFNIIVVAFILLIAYWWANQGLFSAILHCICVIIAGALAFAFWEPVVLGYLLKGSSFDNYSWGMALGILFFLFLVITRVASDLLIPFDIPLPSMANTIGGGIVGFIAGVLTIGMASISCGFIQGPTELMGFIGWARAADSQGAPKQLNQMWIPTANITEDFYRRLSLGGMSPSGKYALATHYPRLAETALSLHRDTFRNGDGRVAIAPKDITVGSLTYDPTYHASDSAPPGAYAIDVTVTTGGYDNGEQFILSCAQAKLSNTKQKPDVAYPTLFVQPMQGSDPRIFSFDDIGNYATSVPGEQDVKITLIFPATLFPESKGPPSIFFIKGLRYGLTTPETIDLAKHFASEGGSEIVEQDNTNPDGGFVRDISDFISIENSLRPVQLNTNNADTLSIVKVEGGNRVSEGKGVFKKGSSVTISREQRVNGFFHPKDTEVVLVDVSRRDNGIDMWGDRSTAFKNLGKDVPIQLVDSRGKTTKPVGYIWERKNDVEIFFKSTKPFQKISELPLQPSSGEQRLKLVFIVPRNSEIVGIMMGKQLIGSCNKTANNGGID